MCDALTNTCAANQAAKDLCTRAEVAASAAKPLTGAQADGPCFLTFRFMLLTFWQLSMMFLVRGPTLCL
jgi:hypothetical protein